MNDRTLGEQYDDLMDRLDRAYAAQTCLRIGTPEYAHAALELVFVDLRALNDLARQSTGGRPSQQVARGALGR